MYLLVITMSAAATAAASAGASTVSAAVAAAAATATASMPRIAGTPNRYRNVGNPQVVLPRKVTQDLFANSSAE